MPGQFFSPEGDLEEHFITNHWLIDQYIGDQLWGWSVNSSGQLGINSTLFKTTPVQEWSSSTNWTQVSGISNNLLTPHSAAIKSDGTLWLWGGNSAGQLGVNDRIARSTPVREWTSSTNWRQVFLGSGVTAAIKTDGTLWLWGGTLGFNDSILQRSTPSQEFTSSTNWKQIVIRRGNRNDFNAIKTDGTLWTWGSNDFGLLGRADISLSSARSTPVQEFTSSTNWKFLLGGMDAIHSAAVKTDGSLWAWGTNNDGSLGMAGTGASIQTTPRQVILTLNENIKSGFCGNRSTHVIKSDGTLWSWGQNYSRELGNSNPLPTSSAVQEASYSTNWKSVNGVYGGKQIIFGIKTDGTLWGWGGNQVIGGLLFPSTSAASQVLISTPIQEQSSSTNWKQVSGALAIRTGIEMDTGNLTS
jgi:alpha-tubulin suppressor-like RCC1 family protein